MDEEQFKSISFLPNPNIDFGKLYYIVDKKEIYVNLFEFSIKRDLKIYKYPFTITPQIYEGMDKLKQNIFSKCLRDIKQIYGSFFISGDSIYSTKKIEEISNFKSVIFSKGRYEYKIEIQKYTNEKIIKNEDIKKDTLTKQFIEILIKDIFNSNPKLDFDKGLFVLKSDKRIIETDRVSINYYPGFTTRFIETESGNYINISLKNKIESSQNILEFLKARHYYNKNNQEKLKEELVGRMFYYGKKNIKLMIYYLTELLKIKL